MAFKLIPMDEEQTPPGLPPMQAPTVARGPETLEDAFKRTGVKSEPDFEDIPSFLTPIDNVPAAPAKPKPYDWTALGVKLPDYMRPAGDMIAGANSALAGITGLALDDIDIIMQDLGMGGLMDEPGTGKQKVIAALEKAGIGADKAKAANQFFADMGESAGENLIMLAAMMGAIPALISAQGPSAVAQFSRSMGQGLAAHPGAAAVAEIGAGFGGEVGSDIGGTMGPTGEALGGIAGGLAGGALGMIPGGNLVKGAVQGFSDISAAARTGRSAMQNTPLLTDSRPESDLISQAIKADQLRVDNIITRLQDKLVEGADPITNTRKLQAAQRAAFTKARVIEDGYWKNVDKQRKMPTAGIKTWSQGLLKATAKEGRSDFLPGDLMAKIKGLPANASLDRLRAIRTITAQRLQSGTVPTAQGVMPLNDSLRRNMKLMVQQIDTEIENAFPNDIELRKASNFSRWIHDKFTRGPVAQFSRPRSQEGQLPSVRQSGRTAIADDRFGGQTADIAEKLELPGLIEDAKGFLQGQLAEELSKGNPQAVQKYMERPQTKAFLKAFPQVAASVQSSANRLTKATTMKREMFHSAFVNAMNEAPETAINKVITSARKTHDAKALMARIKNRPEALEAAKNQTILELERIAGGNPAKVLDILGSPDTRTAVKTILGDDLDRLERIARDSAHLMQAQDGMPRYLLQRGGRVMGAFLARRLNTGTLQAPEIGGRLAQRVVEDFLGRTEKDIFVNAVRSPAWEAILRAKMPTNNSELLQLKQRIKRVIRTEEATERAAAPMMDDEDDDE